MSEASAPLRSRGGGILLALALALVLGCCGFFGAVVMWVNGTSDKEAMETATHQIAGLKPLLMRVYAAVPPLSGLALKPCADVEIKARYRDPVSTGTHGEAVLWVSRVPHDVLGAWLQGARFHEEGPQWFWLADSTTKDIMEPSRYDLPSLGRHIQSEVRRFRQRRYLGVLRSSSQDMPRATGEGAPFSGRVRLLEKGKSFEPGFFHGWLVVMDMDTASATCQAPIDVESHETLTYWSYGPMSRRPNEVLSGDFKDRLRTASKDALARISTSLRFSP
jgi:hypothetical protein